MDINNQACAVVKFVAAERWKRVSKGSDYYSKYHIR